MKVRILSLLLALVLVAVLGACAKTPEPEPDSDAAGGTRLAAGLYDQEDGTVVAVGTLVFVDLEGGYYAITGANDETVAVINNGDEFADELDALIGKTVNATGTRFEGTSTRMAGPEIVVETIDEVFDTPVE